MTTMIYIRRTTNRYNEPTGFKRLAFSNAEAMGQQIEWVLDEIKRDKGTPKEWNDSGDECNVEPAYASGCQLNELMVRHMKPFLDAYPHRGKGEPLNPKSNTRPSMPFAPMDEKRSIREVSWYTTDFGGEQQRSAQNMYERNLITYDQAIGYMKRNKPVAPLAFRYTDCGQDGSGHTHFIHIIPSLGADTYLNADKFNGFNRTMGELLKQEADEEFEAWYAYSETDAYKKEVEAKKQAEADLRTTMGESGYTSYSRDSDGRITMWR